MRDIKYIFVHCTGTLPDVPVMSIMSGFRRRGWHQPGYHYLIDFEGMVHRLCLESTIANGVYGYNSNALHVAYIGGIDPAGRAADTRSLWQKKSLETVVRMLQWRYPQARVLGHRDVNKHKACPCFDARTLDVIKPKY